MHPATSGILQYFTFDHLPPKLMEVSKPFCLLAVELANDPALDGPELTVCLRKLLEAKDSAVRAAL